MVIRVSELILEPLRVDSKEPGKNERVAKSRTSGLGQEVERADGVVSLVEYPGIFMGS